MAIEQFEFRGAQWKRIPATAFERWIVGVDIGQSQDPTAISIMRHHCDAERSLERGQAKKHHAARG